MTMYTTLYLFSHVADTQYRFHSIFLPRRDHLSTAIQQLPATAGQQPYINTVHHEITPDL